MRRYIAAILASVAAITLATLLATALPAGAHPRFQPQAVQPGAPVAISLVVDSHFDAALTSVAIRTPATFRLDRVDPPPGWAQAGGTDLRFTGRLTPGSVVLFTVRGTPTEKGLVHFPVTTGSAAGEVQEWTGECTTSAPYKAAFLFVGVVEDCDRFKDGGGLPLGAAGVALIAVGCAGLVAFTVVSRRRLPQPR